MTQKRTLIVDDEPDIRELLEITLGRMGIETATAPGFAQRHCRTGRRRLRSVFNRHAVARRRRHRNY